MERPERRLEAGHDHALDVAQGHAHLRVHQPQLLRHGGVGDEAVVGVDGHAQAEVEVELERVRLRGRARRRSARCDDGQHSSGMR